MTVTNAQIMAAATPNGLPFVVSNHVVSPKATGYLWVWFLSIQFPDGNRSAVSLSRLIMPRTPSGAAGNQGWTPLLTVPDSKGGVGQPSPSAALFDQRMAAGDVLYWFQGSSDGNYARGLWSRQASQCVPGDVNAFAWGLSQLAATVSQAPVVSGAPVGASPPPPQQTNMPPATPIIITPAPPPRRWPYVVAGLAAIGLVGYAVLD